MRVKTDQEHFWAGEFGDVYTERNVTGPQAREGLFRKILAATEGVKSICELGANRGDNLGALRNIREDLELTGVELNASAAAVMRKLPRVRAVVSSIQDFETSDRFDLVFTCGVLIHLNPDDLPSVYAKMVALSSRYIMVNEYFNPTPVELDYRGHGAKLFKRDFAGELLDQTNVSLKIVDYGFLWRRAEPAWDDTTWTLLENTSPRAQSA